MTGPHGGIDPATINPPDAVAALRSFPRRWRSALAFVADDPAAGELVRRRSGDSSSALEHAWYVAELLRTTSTRIRRARREERPALEGDGVARASGPQGQDDGALEAALAAIDEHAPALAATLEGLGPDDWGRAANLDGREVTILTMAQHSVADAAHRLRAAERALRAARGSAR